MCIESKSMLDFKKKETRDTSFDGYKPIIDTIELKVQICMIYIQIIKIMI